MPSGSHDLLAHGSRQAGLLAGWLLLMILAAASL